MNNLNPKKDESSDSKVRFRCPSCSKLYISNPAAIFVEKPEYKCTSCSASFYISLNEALNASEVVGYEIVVPQFKDEQMTNLEKTPEPNLKIDEINWSIVDTALDFKEDQPKSVIEQKWNVVLQDFSNTDKHNDFIQFAKKNDEVEYTKSVYGEILKANPYDEVARSYFNQIEISEETNLLLAKEEDKQYLSLSLWSSIVVGLGLLFILLGLFVVPEYHKLIGLGIGLVVFTFALKSLFQKNPAPY